MANVNLCCPIVDCWEVLETREEMIPDCTLYCVVHGYKFSGEEKDIDLNPNKPEPEPEAISLRDRFFAATEPAPEPPPNEDTQSSLPFDEEPAPEVYDSKAQEWLNARLLDTRHPQADPPAAEPETTSEHPETD